MKGCDSVQPMSGNKIHLGQNYLDHLILRLVVSVPLILSFLLEWN
jgi:hypothetical protein